jgi:anaerobic magnesium-protoporphyrin IX monomethyl ester cyclase
MRILFVHPNYSAGAADIAGNWSPAWVAYMAGYLKAGGYDDYRFVDAWWTTWTTIRFAPPSARASRHHRHHGHDADDLRRAAGAADRQGENARTPSPSSAASTHLHVQAGAGEAPWIDVIVRGEGEAVTLNLVRAIDEGAGRRARPDQGHRLPRRRRRKVVATPAEPSIKDVDSIKPDWGMLEWKKYIYIPLGVPVATPNMARGCPFTCSFCSQWKFWRDYRVRDPKKMVDEIEELVKVHGVGFFILADEEPTINQGQVHRVLPGADRPRPGHPVGHQHPRHGRHAR